MKPFIEQAKHYAAQYGQGVTHYASMLSIPLIIFSLMVLLGFVHLLIPGLFDFNFACIATVILLIYYVRLEWRLTLTLTPILVFLLWIAEFFSYDGPSSFSVWIFVILFLLGAFLLLLGLIVDGQASAWDEKARCLLIAPLCLVADIIFMAGRMQSLQEAIYGKADNDLKNVP